MYKGYVIVCQDNHPFAPRASLYRGHAVREDGHYEFILLGDTDADVRQRVHAAIDRHTTSQPKE